MNLQIEHTGLARNTITNEIIYTDFTAKYEEDSVLFLTDEEFNKYASCAVRAHAENKSHVAEMASALSQMASPTALTKAMRHTLCNS